jgi:membrane protease YdiL (CAAX protease family)
MRLTKNDWLRVLLILVGGFILNTWAITWIKFEKLPVSTFWWVIIERTASAVVSLIAIRAICPNALSRFSLGRKPKEFFIALGVVLFLMGPSLWRTDYHGAGIPQIIESFVFALFIGIDEDFFSRGFIFGALERHGFWLAALLSSVNFGLLHFQNIIWGGQSAAYTITQVINAAGFGFLAVALMIYSGTIWIPILMHGLCDFPMQFETATQYRKGVTGGGDWAGVFIDLLIYSVIGWFLIMLSDPARKDRVLNFGKKVGLVEPEAEVSQGR